MELLKSEAQASNSKMARIELYLECVKKEAKQILLDNLKKTIKNCKENRDMPKCLRQCPTLEVGLKLYLKSIHLIKYIQRLKI